jgi:hypothetical protein
MEPLLSNLPARQRDRVLLCVAELEDGDVPLPASAPALADPLLREHVEAVLRAHGRCLVDLGDAWMSGYADEIANELVRSSHSYLTEIDRAVLGLVYLHAKVIPRSEGVREQDLPRPVGLDVIASNRDRRLSKETIKQALTRLREADIIRAQHEPGVRQRGRPSTYVPGPQFQRLTPLRRRRIWEQTVLTADPDGPLAVRLRRELEAHEEATQR